MANQARRKAQKQNSRNRSLVWGALALIVVVIAGFWFMSSGNSQYPLEISVSDAAAKRDSGAFILDVRQPDEWNEVHIPGATLIPLDQLASRVDELPRDQEIVVVCRSGNRSQAGRDVLLQAGFTQVTSMAGGVTQWKSAGYETVSGP